MKDIYENNESISRFYDIVYDKILDKSGLKFYLKEIAEANGPVLEIGAGTGRIFVPALKNGADIYGIDQSNLMLDKLRSKINEKDKERIFLSDVRELSLKKRFNLIIAPFRIFQHLLSIEDQLTALNKIYDHLEDGGKFIFDVFVPNLEKINSERVNVPEFDGEYETGKRLQRSVTIKNNYIEQILDITFKFIWDENGEENKSEAYFPFRYFFRYELENLIGRTPFKLEKVYGDFKKGSLSNDSTDFVMICKK
ncbi:MAG TPA: class I SAM-dependent methyltransferase [Ignavibacteria bacterium]|nr:class I SAM-dependent methyltransferase [Ignavibacteria bacterium]